MKKLILFFVFAINYSSLFAQRYDTVSLRCNDLNHEDFPAIFDQQITTSRSSPKVFLSASLGEERWLNCTDKNTQGNVCAYNAYLAEVSIYVNNFTQNDILITNYWAFFNDDPACTRELSATGTGCTVDIFASSHAAGSDIKVLAGANQQFLGKIQFWTECTTFQDLFDNASLTYTVIDSVPTNSNNTLNPNSNVPSNGTNPTNQTNSGQISNTATSNTSSVPSNGSTSIQNGSPDNGTISNPINSNSPQNSNTIQNNKIVYEKQQMQQTINYINQSNTNTQVINQGIQNIASILTNSLATQNANLLNEANAVDDRLHIWEHFTSTLDSLSVVKYDSAKIYYKNGNETSAIQNRLEMYYYEALNDATIGCVNSYKDSKAEAIANCPTSGYILFRRNEENVNNAYNLKSIEIEKFKLPDVFNIPLCKVYDKNPVRDSSYQKGFNFIKNCNNIYLEMGMSSGFYSVDCKKNTTGFYNEDSALYYMTRNISECHVNNTVDLMDYTTTFLWYNCLKLKNAKTVGDLIQILKTDEHYFEKAPNWSVYYNSLGGDEKNYLKLANDINNYYIINTSYILYINLNINNKNDLFKAIERNLSYCNYNYEYEKDPESFNNKMKISAQSINSLVESVGR